MSKNRSDESHSPMSLAALVLRFAVLLTKRLWKFVHSQQLTLALLVPVSGALAQILSGNFSFESFRERPWSTLIGYIIAAGVIALVLIVFAAYDLQRELNATVVQERGRAVLREFLQGYPTSASKTASIAIGGFFVLIVFALELIAWHAAYPQLVIGPPPLPPAAPSSERALAIFKSTDDATRTQPSSSPHAAPHPKADRSDTPGIPDHQGAQADVSLTFVNPTSVAFNLSNDADTRADKVELEVITWDLDKDISKSLPPVLLNIEYVAARGGSLNIPTIGTQVPSEIAVGDRIYGVAWVQCYNCKYTRWYLLTYLYNVGGCYYSAKPPGGFEIKKVIKQLEQAKLGLTDMCSTAPERTERHKIEPW
jgi:hypothetical protein